MSECTLNSMKIDFEPGETILTAARREGIRIPTLCFLEGKEPMSACRVCVVEVEGAPRLAAACSTPIRDGMVIMTNSPRVREARKEVVSLTLSEHEGNCSWCDRSDDCELKALAYELGIREAPEAGEKPVEYYDESTFSLVRNSAKCIKCRRCVTACNSIQGVGALYPQGRGFSTEIAPAFAGLLSTVACVQCGQCAAVCPVGAITEKTHIPQVVAALEDPKRHVIVQTAPAIRAALGECFDMPPGSLVTGKMVTALKRMGFDAVFDTNFAADLTILEEGTELLQRLKTVVKDGGEAALPQFTSCSPGWIQFTEYYYPEFLPNLSTCKSPQQMFGALAKTYYAAKAGVDPEDMTVVSIMPCTAKKFEAAREEMNDSGYQDVDYVLTTRELGRLILQSGLDFVNLPDSEMDAPLGISSGAADIFANTGGVMEAALRTVHEIVTGRPLPSEDLHIKPLSTLEGIKTLSLVLKDTVKEWNFLEDVEVRLAVAHGLANASSLLEAIKAGEETFHFVEIMTCPGGCIGGGGQPRLTNDSVRQARIDAIFREDEGKPIRKSHENPAVASLYRDFLGEPLGEKSHHLLHTGYKQKKKVNMGV
ncbi:MULTISPECIES: NADH-dependent [FeFe] hydrogenase, group A6 [unclassified Oceanispirochaeta]|uniref:NADH-dependent [FeFe] hydrogenase, group A6 n=1 Tax=unclassified Oceanispirochaeta TaxID=2635722 RepID=UPI000E09A7CB|nr:MULTISPECIES: NADH-dependent [FeFe] hydrogenase, group A6 [unclassified Oceanispirochaeta]MBF9014321.1 iron hydrogenase small subunit [Oceanispirochaeta sp. M2]NPD71207.1 2Fe-2S iron-sulfur cluster binding domain-containing protein [Oceanispirochaeta sp. M1]RDG33594.1 ferredoxin [Oceanispirochaeta sp. M1]